MAVDERRRHEMYLSLEQALGREAADTLMELVPPVGWADVATKHDIQALEAATQKDIKALAAATKKDIEGLEHRLNANLQAGLNSQTKTLVIAMVGTMIGAMVAIAGLRVF